ncbi:MAG TPA: ABC transporter permease subunit [Ilumatobacteraceae bacterium]|nr:ABC transporter permease subunit [Ilumatobacteraceae bacterium]
MRRLRPLWFGIAAFALLVVMWEVYRRWIGEWLDTRREVGSVLGFKLLPRSSELAMPAVGDMLDEFGKPEVRGSGTSVFEAVLAATFRSFTLALAALALGSLVGIGVAVLMARFKVVQRGLMPYLVISQTIPLIALAPLTVTWGGEITIFGFEWEKWTSAVVLGAFLSFFPIAVGALRGFNSPAASSIELMDSYAASWFQTWRKLRLPAALPYLTPAMRLAGSAAVFGVVVSEISVGLTDGVGYLILSYLQEGTSRPAKVFTAVMGTVVLGLLMAALVAAGDRYFSRNRPKEGIA